MSNGYEENKNPKAQYVKSDVSDSSHFRYHLNELKPELVYALHCYPRSISFQNPIRDMQVNYESMITLCEAAEKQGFGIVFSSNSGLLGPPLYLPYDERHPLHPITPYDGHKLASENLLRLYWDNYQVPSYIFRFASVYGPRQRPNLRLGWLPLIPTWIQGLRKNNPVRLEGDGHQTRDFIYVADVVSALLKAGNVLKYAEGSVGPFLLASGTETRICDLLTKLNELIPNMSIVERAPEKLGNIRRMTYDITAVRLALNWQPETTLEEGLKQTVAWWLKSA